MALSFSIISLVARTVGCEIVGEAIELFINTDAVSQELVGEMVSEGCRVALNATDMLIRVRAGKMWLDCTDLDVAALTVKLGFVLILAWILWIRGRRNRS